MIQKLIFCHLFCLLSQNIFSLFSAFQVGTSNFRIRQRYINHNCLLSATFYRKTTVVHIRCNKALVAVKLRLDSRNLISKMGHITKTIIAV